MATKLGSIGMLMASPSSVTDVSNMSSSLNLLCIVADFFDLFLCDYNAYILCNDLFHLKRYLRINLERYSFQ